MSEHVVCAGTGKQRLTHERAVAAAKRARRVQGDNTSEYYCQACGWWHIGHRVPRRRKWQRRSRRRTG